MSHDPVTPTPPSPLVGPSPEVTPGWEVLSPEEYPDISQLEIEDDKPVDNIFAEKQHRLLTEPLYSSWQGPEEGQSFLALANVGLFFADKEPPLAPDVMLSLEVPQHRDLSRKENRSYLTWVMGKPPTVVFEFVSDRRGGEATHKKREYARIGVTYYVIFDPRHRLGEETVRVFALREGQYQPMAMNWLSGAGLGLTLWEGSFEGQVDTWLRWCDQQGQPIPTGRERAELQQQRAEQAEQRAEQAEQRAEQADQRAERLAARLRELGIEPEE
jgi:hypothetical protein